MKVNAYKSEELPEIVEYHGKPLENGQIGLLGFRGNLWVVATWQGELLFGDGQNACALEDGDGAYIRQRLEANEPGFKVRCLRYEYQDLDDHCASSGVLIELELRRMMKLGMQIRDEIEPNLTIIKQLIKKGHPCKADRELARAPNLRIIQKRNCTYCGKYYIKRAHRLKHEAVCFKKGQ